ncbi:sigma-70 family RNA polymerase sigma factor [Chitinophaga pendula]|uniref:RNA polymerase sigma factor n=1 Tax=Chitinophaga TaxID=79328 RepID=UPI000BAFBF96|nr:MULTISPECIES: sigma-70 family RNA polymerase sigma factor [Chitinophaga]ASZ09900.1 hypothetical protein CK934_02340 [Chitinophaga sp. MD30]UCJ07160.1 sigma-70 family RNA polymerase sigma factor [Chitinophaga pendula]
MAEILNTDEQERWRSFQSGDKHALEYFFNKYADDLYNYGYRFAQDQELIKDAIQDVYIRLWTTRERIAVPTSVKFYLLRSFRNALTRKLSKAAKDQHGQLDEQYLFEVELSAEDLRINDEKQAILQQRLQKAIAQLPPRQREAVFLRFYENTSYEDIALIMGTSVKATYKAVFRALGKLKEIMTVMLISLLLLKA